MQLDDPFPIEKFPQKVQEAILDAFGGCRPSLREVVSISDEHWLQMPRIGPLMLLRLRSVVQDSIGEGKASALLTEDELRSERHRLQGELQRLEDEFYRQRREIRAKLMVINAKLGWGEFHPASVQLGDFREAGGDIGLGKQSSALQFPGAPCKRTETAEG
jgi:hypothetical protein